MKNRSMKPVDEMAEELVEHRDQSGYTRKIYKAESDDHKAELLQADISNRINSFFTLSVVMRLTYNRTAP